MFILIMDILTVALSAVVKIGMVSQYRKNRREASVAGISTIMFVAMAASYDFWVLDGVLHMNIVTIGGQLAGGVLGTLIGMQVFKWGVMPKVGLRMNDFGHYNGRFGRYNCTTCDVIRRDWPLHNWDLGFGPWSAPCPYCKRGRLHINRPDGTCNRGETQSITVLCDNCRFQIRRFVYPVATVPRAEATFWLQSRGFAWRQVTLAEYRAEEDAAGGSPADLSASQTRLPRGFMSQRSPEDPPDTPLGLRSGLVVYDGFFPEGDESWPHYLWRRYQ